MLRNSIDAGCTRPSLKVLCETIDGAFFALRVNFHIASRKVSNIAANAPPIRRIQHKEPKPHTLNSTPY